MKKFVALVVGIFLVLGLAGCGNKPTSSLIAPTLPVTGTVIKTPSVTPTEAVNTPAGATATPTDKVEPTPTAKPTDAATNTPVPTDTPTPVSTNTPTPTNTPAPTAGAQDPMADGKLVVVLDPGHGGSWTGAVSGNYVEAVLNLKIANYCYEYLKEHYPSIEVYMTRTDNTVFSTDLATDLKARVNYAVEKKADAIVSLHLNASGTGQASGCLICTQHRASVKAAAGELGTRILEQLEALGIKSRAMTKGERTGLYIRYSSDNFDENGNPKEYYQICRNAADNNLVGIIVEHAFIDSAADSVFFDSEEDLKALGVADALGIAAYFGVGATQ